MEAEQISGTEGDAPQDAPSQSQPKKRPSGAFYRRRAKERRLAVSLGLVPPDGPHLLSTPVELFGGRSIEEVVQDPASVKWALGTVSNALVQRRIDPKLGNAITYAINAYAARFDREFEQQRQLRELAQKDRELELKAQEIAEAGRLAAALEAHHARQPGLVQAVQVLVGGDAASRQESPRLALESTDSGA